MNRLFFTSLPLALLLGCSSAGNEFGPTIADLESLPPIIDSVEIEPQAKFEIDRQQVIDSFRALVEITADGGGSGDELRRLADLELEASLDNRLSDDSETQQQGLEEAADAISIYENYLLRYPGRADNDLILYQLSRAYALEAQSDKSLAALDRIAHEFPASKYIDEVEFRRGETLFVAREYEAAEQAYATVVKQHPDSLYYEKSIYKYGWTQFKQGRYEDALASYILLLDHNLEQGKIDEIGLGEQLSRADQELLDDVLRVVSLSFSYEEDKQYISNYFNTNGKRDYEPLLYLRLGELYLDKDRVVDGSDLFLAYGSEYPYSPHTPYFHQRAIEIFQQAGYTDLVLQQKIDFVNRYDVATRYWQLQNIETQAKLTPDLVLHISELATHFHALARASKKPADFQQGAAWYRRFLKSFPDHENAARMNFLLAESLYDAGNFPQAIDEYEKTAYAYATHPDSAEAGYASLVAFDALFKTTNASDILLLRRKRIQSAVRFTTSFPGDARIADVELQTARQFLEWKDYAQAEQSAQRLIDNEKVGRASKQIAWGIVADAQFSGANFVSAEASYTSLLGFLPANDAQRKPIREQIASSIYKQGEVARDNKDYATAAVHFSRLGTVIPESPIRVVADYDAASAYVELADWPAVISQLEAFRRNYPRQPKWQTGVTEKLALAYSETGNQALAAREMLQLSSLSPSPQRKQDLMWRAAELYQEAGQSAQAIEIYKGYVKSYPNPLARSIELRFKIAESYRLADNRKQLNYWLNEIVIADARGGAQRSPRSKYLAASASLELIEPTRRAYQQTRLTVPLKTSLGKKKKLMQQSIDAYSRAMKYQVAEVTTEATYQIAEIYHEFARALLSSQRPRGLNEEELEEYDLLLEEQAFPFEEKAIEIHLANFKRIPGGTYDEPTQKSLKVLGELMPFRFARAEISDDYVETQ